MALVGKTNEERIWNFLKSKGLNDFGAAGLMGNLNAESCLRPNNLEDSYQGKLGMTDESYTAAVDNGSYSNFANDCAGYGLAQWTYRTRKAALLVFAQACGASIGDLEMQLDFLWKEMSESYKSMLTTLKKASSVREASDKVLTQYERPADMGEATKATRAALGQTYYNKYAGQTSTAPTEDTPTSIPSPATGVELKEGDIVTFTGTRHYVSSHAASGPACSPGKAKVTAIYKPGESKHPYHLIAIAGGGSTVYGWVDAADIAGVLSGNAATGDAEWTPAPGDVVMFNGGTHYLSANASSGFSCRPGRARITDTYQVGRSKHPYHLIAIAGGGSTVYGWVDAGSLAKD